MYFDNPTGGAHPVALTVAHIHALYLKFFQFVSVITNPEDISRELIVTLSGLFGADGAVFCHVYDDGARFSAAIGTLSHMQNVSLDVNTPRIKQFFERRQARVFTREALNDYVALAMNARFESALIAPIAIDGHPYGIVALAVNQSEYFSEEHADVLGRAMTYLSTLMKHRSRERAETEIGYLERMSATSDHIVHQVAPIIEKIRKTPGLEDVSGLFDNMRALGSMNEPKKFDELILLQDALKGIVAQFRTNLDDQITFNADIREDLPNIRGNNVIFCQIVSEILENARLAVCHGDGQKEISFLAYALPGFAVIDVVNTGKPIAPSDARHLFEPFFSTWPGHKGLGLTWSKFYALRMYGNVSFGRRPDNKTGFRLLFPDEQFAPQVEVF